MVADEQNPFPDLHGDRQIRRGRPSSFVDDDPIVRVPRDAEIPSSDADAGTSDDGSRLGQELGEVTALRPEHVDPFLGNLNQLVELVDGCRIPDSEFTGEGLLRILDDIL